MTTTPNLAQAKWDARRRTSDGLVTVPLVWVRFIMGCSVREFADLLSLQGRKWSPAQISHIENHRRSAGPEFMTAIQELLGAHLPEKTDP